MGCVCVRFGEQEKQKKKGSGGVVGWNAGGILGGVSLNR